MLKQMNTYMGKQISTFTLHHSENYSKWIIELNVKPKSIKPLGENLFDVGLDKDFLKGTQ